MFVAIFSEPNGRISSVFKCSNLMDIPDDYIPVFENFEIDSSLHYYCWNSGKIIEIPTKPTPNHIFDYTIKQWIDPRTPATEWPIIRTERDRRLQTSDWTQLPDVPIATKEAWATYRQALRDITDQPDPFNIVWPEPPK